MDWRDSPSSGSRGAVLGGAAAAGRAYADIRRPILILRGEHAPKPTRFIAETLPTLLPAANLAVIDGTGHMGPLTHVGAVSSAIARHVVQVGAGSPPGRGNCRPPGAARRDVYAAVEVV
jgi:pimeloyl-ACP methyl ester carboxylesterase